MFAWIKNGKLLHHKFSTLYPIAGLSLVYKDGKWEFSGDVGRVAVEIGGFIIDDKSNILVPECYAYETLSSELEDDEKLFRETTGIRANVNVENTYFEDSESDEISLSKYDSEHPFINLYLSQMDNRLMNVKTDCQIDKKKLPELSCSAVIVTDTTCHYYFYQNWRMERTEVVWGYREDYAKEVQGVNENQQRQDLIESLKYLLTTFQYRIAMPSSEIEKVDDAEVVQIGSDKWKNLLAEAFPRPWWIAAWSPKEKRGLEKYIALYREITLSMYEHNPNLVPKPLRILGTPHYDLKNYVKNWNIDVSKSENAIQTTWEEFHSRFTIDENEPRKTIDEAFKTYKVHPYDAANIIAEILRQVDRVFGSNWAGGGIPSKPTVLDPLAPKHRAAVKAYIVEEDEWILSEVGKNYGEYDEYEQKIERILI